MAKKSRTTKRKCPIKRKTKRQQQGGLFPLLALIPAATAAVGKAATAGAVTAAAGHTVGQHLKRKNHIFTKTFWTGPKEVRRGGYIYSADGRYRRKA